MAEIFRIKIENLKKSIPPCVPSRNKEKSKKDSKKKEESKEEQNGKRFCQYHGMCKHTKDDCTTLKALVK